MMTQFLPGRTDSKIKNHWKQMQKLAMENGETKDQSNDEIHLFN
jgi:hypothetical protein